MSDNTRTDTTTPGMGETAPMTTARESLEEAPNPTIAREMQENVLRSREAAQKASQAAQELGPEFTGEPVSGFDVLRHDVEERLNAAVAQGQKDVGKGRDTGAQYIEQARDMVGDALASTQDALHGTFKGTQSHASPAGSMRDATVGALTSLQTIASSTAGVTQQYLASAQTRAQPHVHRAREAVEGLLEKASPPKSEGFDVSEQQPSTTLSDEMPGSLPADMNASAIRDDNRTLNGDQL